MKYRLRGLCAALPKSFSWHSLMLAQIIPPAAPRRPYICGIFVARKHVTLFPCFPDFLRLPSIVENHLKIIAPDSFQIDFTS